MKGEIKEIAAKLTSKTSMDEMISYCNTVEEFDELFNEYCKTQSKKLSVFLAYVLRHNPAVIGIELDKHGWAGTEELIKAINRSGRNIDIIKLEEIVATDDKGRFSFNEDKSKIRANQGHSVNVDLQFKRKTPPNILYHGTAEKYLESIKQNGIQKRNRQYVHLSLSERIALNVGSRHGKPVVLKIDARQMVADGYKFFLTENGVWLTDSVPFKYVVSAARI